MTYAILLLELTSFCNSGQEPFPTQRLNELGHVHVVHTLSIIMQSGFCWIAKRTTIFLKNKQIWKRERRLEKYFRNYTTCRFYTCVS